MGKYEEATSTYDIKIRIWMKKSEGVYEFLIAEGGTLRLNISPPALRADVAEGFCFPPAENDPPDRFFYAALSPYLSIDQNEEPPIGWFFILVPKVGLEPTRCRQQRILSPSRLPIPSLRLSVTILA